MSKENSFVLTTAVFPLVRLPYKKHDARNQLRGSLFEINVSTTSHVFCLLEKASSIHIFLSQLRDVICSFFCKKSHVSRKSSLPKKAARWIARQANYLRKFKHREPWWTRTRAKTSSRSLATVLQFRANVIVGIEGTANSLDKRIAIIRMFIKTQTNSMRPSCC